MSRDEIGAQRVSLQTTTIVRKVHAMVSVSSMLTYQSESLVQMRAIVESGRHYVTMRVCLEEEDERRAGIGRCMREGLYREHRWA